MTSIKFQIPPLRTLTSEKGATPLMIGVFAYVSHLLVSAVLWAADQFGLSRLEILLLASVFAILLLSIALREIALPKIADVRSSVREMKVAGWILVSYISLVGFVALFFHWSLPASGWDTLSFWADVSGRFLEHIASQSVNPFTTWGHRHPHTLAMLAAWSGWVTEVLVARPSGYWPWLGAWLGSGLIVYGFAQNIGMHRTQSLTLMVILLSIPLVENHQLIGGYAELHVGHGLLAAGSLIAIGLARENHSLIFSGVILSLSIIFLKNTGIVYAAIPIFSYLAIFSMARGTRVIFVILFFITTAVALISTIEFPILSNILHISWESARVYIAGRELEFADVNWLAVSGNMIFSQLKNQSFSMMFLCFILCFSGARKDEALLFIQLCVGVGLAALIASQFTTYGFQYATPWRDTGNSRFSLPVMMLVPLSLALLIGKFDYQEA